MRFSPPATQLLPPGVDRARGRQPFPLGDRRGLLRRPRGRALRAGACSGRIGPARSWCMCAGRDRINGFFSSSPDQRRRLRRAPRAGEGRLVLLPAGAWDGPAWPPAVVGTALLSECELIAPASIAPTSSAVHDGGDVFEVPLRRQQRPVPSPHPLERGGVRRAARAPQRGQGAGGGVGLWSAFRAVCSAHEGRMPSRNARWGAISDSQRKRR